MKFRLQTFSPESGGFVDENVQSDDLEALKRLSSSKSYAGVKLRILNFDEEVVFEADGQTTSEDNSISDVAAMLGRPADDPAILRRHKRKDEDEGDY